MAQDEQEEWKEVHAEWKEGLSFLGTNLSGGQVQMGMLDGKPGISPMELILIGLGGCTGMDVASILQKMKQDFHDMRITVRGKRAKDHPKVYTEIDVLFEFWGNQLSPRAVESAIELSEAKYCSVSAMLRNEAKISTRYQIYSIQAENSS